MAQNELSNPIIEASESGSFSPAAGGLTYLEQVAAPTCVNVPMLVGKNEVKMSAVLFRPRCKCWNCQTCARINADLWTMRGVMGAQLLAEAGHELRLVTITAHERHSVRRAVEVLPSGWNKLRNRWQRATTKPQYILIPEVGKRGQPISLKIRFLCRQISCKTTT